MTPEAEIKRLKVAKVKCESSLMFFTRFFFKELKGEKFITNWHHETIVAALKRVENYEIELLNINIPPRYSKTALAAVNFIANGLSKNPLGNYLYITASDELRSQTSVEIRDIVSSDLYKKMYGIELKKDQNGKNLWRTLQGGGVKTATIFGQITGFGAGQMIEHDKELADYIRNFEGCIVIDDGNKIDDAEQNNANNEKVLRVLFNTILSRKNSKDTPIINIQQRAGLNDITSALLDHYGPDSPKIENLVMPVIKDGQPLWEYKHNIQDIEDLKSSPKTAHIFETQYMQNPMPLTGLLFPATELKRFKVKDLDRTKIEALHSYTDTADTGKDNWCTGFGENIGKDIYLTDLIFSTNNADIMIPICANKIKEKKVPWSQIEVNREGRMVIKLIKQIINDETLEIQGIWSKTNKHTRIIMIAGMIKEYVHFLDSSEYEPDSDYDRFMRQITTYAKDGSSKKDDAPDMLAGLIKFITYSLDHIYE